MKLFFLALDVCYSLVMEVKASETCVIFSWPQVFSPAQRIEVLPQMMLVQIPKHWLNSSIPHALDLLIFLLFGQFGIKRLCKCPPILTSGALKYQ